MDRPAHDLAELRIARFLLDQLADGIDPATKQPLPRDHAAQDPDSIRAIFRASRLLHGLEEDGTVPLPLARRPFSSASHGAGKRPRAGRPWTRQEEHRLAEAFRQRNDLRSIARAHGRTSDGIAARLVRLGLIRSRRDARYGPQPL